MNRRPLLAVFTCLLLTLACGERPAAHAAPGLAPQDTSAHALDSLLAIASTVSSETPQWTPDGSQVLFVSSRGGRRGLWGADPSGGAPEELTPDIGNAGHFLAKQHPKWSPSGRFVAYLSSPPEADDQSQELWLWSPDDGPKPLTNLGGRINSFRWSPDGSHIAFASDRFGNYDVWTVRVSDGTPYRLTDDDRYEVFPSWTPDGQHLLYVRLNDAWTAHDVLEIPAEGGAARTVVRDTAFFDYRAGGTFGYPDVSPSGDQVLFRSYRSGWINYWLVPRAGDNGERADPVQIAAAEAEQSHARWSPSGERILYVENHNGTAELRVVRADGGAPEVIVQPDSMGVVSAPEWSPDGASISYFYETPTTVRDLYVVDVESGATTQLTQSMPNSEAVDALVTPKKITYESTDGYTIPAYLYAPDNASADEPRPGLLWIHGGPTSQYMDTFEQHVQYFVQQGYVVLQPNIRGSSGYGKAFADANNGCWGHCDLEDVLAGKAFLGSLGYVDTTSVGITGTSYGGCMSLSAIAFAPDAFQASIPISGYGDWVHFMKEQEMRHVKLLEYEFGPIEEHRDVYVANSPIYAVEAVQTPTLLVHGEGFFPESEASALFAKELERHYKVHTHKTYPKENYYVYRRENRRQMLLDMKAFFGRFLRDDVVDRTAAMP